MPGNSGLFFLRVSTVRRWFYLRWDNGLWRGPNQYQYRSMTSRETNGREASPSAGVIASQSANITESGSPSAYDVGKKILGRKRHIFTKSRKSSGRTWAASGRHRWRLRQRQAQERLVPDRQMVPRNYRIFRSASLSTGIEDFAKRAPINSPNYVFPLPIKLKIHVMLLSRWHSFGVNASDLNIDL